MLKINLRYCITLLKRLRLLKIMLYSNLWHHVFEKAENFKVDFLRTANSDLCRFTKTATNLSRAIYGGRGGERGQFFCMLSRLKQNHKVVFQCFWFFDGYHMIRKNWSWIGLRPWRLRFSFYFHIRRILHCFFIMFI